MKTITIGRILKPQGLKGEIKVEPITDDMTQYFSLKKIYIEGKEYTIKQARERQGFVYLFLVGIDNCEQVELLRNKFIDRERQEETNSKGEYYLVDLMDCNIVDEKNVLKGRVTSLDDYGSALVVTFVGKLGEFSFPFVIDDVVTKVDINNKVIYVDSKRLSEVIV